MWTLAERLTYVRFERLVGKLAIVDAWLFVDTLAVRLGEMGMQTLTETLVKAEANAVVHIPFKTPQETLTQV